MKKNIAVFLIVFAFFASAGIALQPQITPFFQKLFYSVTALTSRPPEQTPAASIDSGDVNGDLTVNFVDLWMVAQAWDTKDAPSDQYRDGKINALDAAVVLNNMNK